MAKRARVELPLPVFSELSVLRVAPDGTEESNPSNALDAPPATGEEASKALQSGRAAWERGVGNVLSADGEVAAAAHMAHAFGEGLLLPARIARAPLTPAAQARHVHLRIAHKQRALTAAAERLRSAAQSLRGISEAEACVEEQVRALRQRWRVRLVQGRLGLLLDGARADLVRSATSPASAPQLQLAHRLPTLRLRPASSSSAPLLGTAHGLPLQVAVAEAQRAVTARTALALLSQSVSAPAPASLTDTQTSPPTASARQDALFISSASPSPLLIHLASLSSDSAKVLPTPLDVSPYTLFSSLLLEALLVSALATSRAVLTSHTHSQQNASIQAVLAGALSVRSHVHALQSLCDLSRQVCSAVPGLGFALVLMPCYTSSSLAFHLASQPLLTLHLRGLTYQIGAQTYQDCADAMTQVLRQVASRLFNAMHSQASVLPAPFRLVQSRTSDLSMRVQLPGRASAVALRVQVVPAPQWLALALAPPFSTIAVPVALFLHASRPFTALWPSINSALVLQAPS